jgi:hypothetical protein
MACQHEDFEAHVDVGRITPADGADVKCFVAEITVKCKECGQSFGWRGVPPGANYDSPTRSVDALELRAPMLSPAELALAEPLAGMSADPWSGEPGVSFQLLDSQLEAEGD